MQYETSPDSPKNDIVGAIYKNIKRTYRIYSINRPGRLLNFLTLRVGAYSRWVFMRGWALIKFSPFSASVVVYFATKQ